MSRKICWYLHTGFAGCTHDGEIEVPDDATEDQIEELVKDEAFNNIDWGWTEAVNAADSGSESEGEDNACDEESGADSAEKQEEGTNHA